MAKHIPNAPEALSSQPTPLNAIHAAIEQSSQIILGKTHQIRQTLACLLARGHLLIEDVPGVGKTTLAHTLASTLGLDFQRIQFTSDLLPADITGASIYERENGSFRFHPGPIFSQLVLADEVNRATPKTQSALLEAMEERQVTVDGNTYALPEPFFVIATQNPTDQSGTFTLPESQLDRFLMRIHIGYPDAQAERALLQGRDRRDLLAQMTPTLAAPQMLALQRATEQIHVADPLVDYVQALIRHTRENTDYRHGLSPRAGLALIRAAQAWALLEGRDHLIPEDIQSVLGPVVNHRLQLGPGADGPAPTAEALIQAVPIP